jgi:uncharacterized Zn finger protein
MAEMRNLECPSCERSNQPIAVLEGIEEYRCGSCGMVYYGPCGCDTAVETRAEAVEAAEAEKAELASDWEMSAREKVIEEPAKSQTQPGGC